jgi:hypothetical protein
MNILIQYFEKYTYILIGKPEGKRPLGVDGWIILKWV